MNRTVTICKDGPFWLFKDSQGGEKRIPIGQFRDLEEIAFKYQDAGYHIQIRRDKRTGDKLCKAYLYDHPARLDVIKTCEGWRAYEYPQDWDVYTSNTHTYILDTQEEVRARLDELEALGYTVFSWELSPSKTGYRAMDRVRSIRTAREIQRMRDQNPYEQIDFATCG